MNIQDRMDMIADNPRLIDVKPLHSALQSVLDLHQPVKKRGGHSVCETCDPWGAYPCWTVRAIETALKEYT